MPLRSSIIENYTYKKGSLSLQIIHNMFVLRMFDSNWLSFSFREQGIRILGRHWLAVVSHSIKIEQWGGSQVLIAINIVTYQFYILSYNSPFSLCINLLFIWINREALQKYSPTTWIDSHNFKHAHWYPGIE